MRLTKSTIKRLIKEEIENILQEKNGLEAFRQFGKNIMGQGKRPAGRPPSIGKESPRGWGKKKEEEESWLSKRLKNLANAKDAAAMGPPEGPSGTGPDYATQDPFELPGGPEREVDPGFVVSPAAAAERDKPKTVGPRSAAERKRARAAKRRAKGRRGTRRAKGPGRRSARGARKPRILRRYAKDAQQAGVEASKESFDKFYDAIDAAKIGLKMDYQFGRGHKAAARRLSATAAKGAKKDIKARPVKARKATDITIGERRFITDTWGIDASSINDDIATWVSGPEGRQQYKKWLTNRRAKR